MPLREQARSHLLSLAGGRTCPRISAAKSSGRDSEITFLFRRSVDQLKKISGLSFSVGYPAQAFLKHGSICNPLRGAMTMHEIPNFPPGQQEPQQSTLAQQELGQAAAMKAAPSAQDSQKARSKD
ncbi:hypothetical protein N015_09805 [Pseudomonas asturiensis]|uniref:Uncharacterized protein n=1 Tax=Pseudomonas asturiensis TaxID=1190415 RepID=A0ABX6HAZ7_9PSED|nr:hypothetical protein [Pseudomonas asturiensis]QHF02687.1 hypothetical protein N015_09805 [Pseudomonas asturiensis]